jgi:hypothetical protein
MLKLIRDDESAFDRLDLSKIEGCGCDTSSLSSGPPRWRTVNCMAKSRRDEAWMERLTFTAGSQGCCGIGQQQFVELAEQGYVDPSAQLAAAGRIVRRRT